ncbi:hypothetical protein NX786_08000 [Telluria mixta]|uniref:Uncharacterized protein n=1 Tax=Telluria mixta TaxID=34071 RepID=A0ABT2BVX0_9BURK|nr:hypothetical protein [Telluria mixta]MCS0629272.1 hypothetical protein [Telluria mixta]WEM97708.1 hypothetical protein P0M04_08310 [Telluria mixta]
MSLVERVVQRVRRDYFRWQYQKVARQILDTRPVKRGDLPFTLLSMVHQRDVHSYLVAVKSFTHFLNPSRIVVVCDPSIDDNDRAVLKHHLPHVILREAGEFTHPDIPRGGTWERLFAISGYALDSYVIQLDADTLTMQPIPEVLQAVQAGAGFVLGEIPDTPIRPLDAVRVHALPKVKPGAHIQTLSEAEMANVGLPSDARYVRGCSGFTGFPPSTTMRDNLLDFSRRMKGKLGDDWKRWGTEQVTSNYLVANAFAAKSLPFPKYGTPDCATAETAFFHFIGPMRFINNKYKTTSRQAIHLISNVPA